VVRSNTEARRCPAESNGTHAMDLGHRKVVLKWCICMFVAVVDLGTVIIIISIVFIIVIFIILFVCLLACCYKPENCKFASRPGKEVKSLCVASRALSVRIKINYCWR